MIPTWPELLADGEVLAAATLGRPLHHNPSISIKGRSYRLRHLEQAISLRSRTKHNNFTQRDRCVKVGVALMRKSEGHLTSIVPKRGQNTPNNPSHSPLQSPYNIFIRCCDVSAMQ